MTHGTSVRHGAGEAPATAPAASSVPAAHWHLVVEPDGRPGPENMAVDVRLLEAAERDGTAWLRLYRWDPPCLSFGCHEAALTRYHRARVAALGLDVVRRPTGGRAVWHEHELTYAVAAPIAAFGTLRAAYRAIHERLAAALRALGAHATLAPVRPPVGLSAGTGACFAAPVGGEILIGGRKVVGSAQLRHGGAFLQHGSVLLDGTQGVVASVSREPGAGSRGTSLRAELVRAVTFDAVAAAIVATWDARLRPSPAVSDHLRPSLVARFSDPSWTWRR